MSVRIPPLQVHPVHLMRKPNHSYRMTLISSFLLTQPSLRKSLLVFVLRVNLNPRTDPPDSHVPRVIRLRGPYSSFFSNPARFFTRLFFLPLSALKLKFSFLLHFRSRSTVLVLLAFVPHHELDYEALPPDQYLTPLSHFLSLSRQSEERRALHPSSFAASFPIPSQILFQLSYMASTFLPSPRFFSCDMSLPLVILSSPVMRNRSLKSETHASERGESTNDVRELALKRLFFNITLSGWLFTHRSNSPPLLLDWYRERESFTRLPAMRDPDPLEYIER